MYIVTFAELKYLTGEEYRIAVDSVDNTMAQSITRAKQLFPADLGWFIPIKCELQDHMVAKD